MPEQSSDFNQKVNRLQELHNELSELSKSRSELLRKIMEAELKRSRRQAEIAQECFQNGQLRRANALLDSATKLLQSHIATLKR